MARQKKSRGSVAPPAIREDVRRIAAAHGAGNVRVFGSVSRGEQDASSDLDLLVDMAEGRSLFDLIALSNDLEESLEVVGEATKQVPDSLRERAPELSWREMAGMRDKLIHDYLGVDLNLVWDVVASELPATRDRIVALIEELGVEDKEEA